MKTLTTTPAHINDTLTDLLGRCKQGEQAAYKEIYHLYAGAMFNISFRILNSTADAEDVLQESFVSAFKNVNQYSGTSSFGAWLKRIVINKSIDFLKTRKPDLISVDEFDQPEDTEEPDDNEHYDVALIKSAISKMPDGYRVILSLYLFEDYTHKMISERLKISEGTSKSQYSRAKKKLLEIMQQKKGHE
ncbi:MAG: RNA polymerase sigma factor [Bacteroidia bacterium]|nr:RNA polymerase sigma factor [Bacteroidia bacterium]